MKAIPSRFMQRYKHSPRSYRQRVHIKAAIITTVILAILVPLAIYKPSVTGMHSAEISVDSEALEKELYNQINQFRADNGLEIIKRSIRLEAIARKTSQNMAENKSITPYLESYEQSKLYCNFHAENILKTESTDILQELVNNETLKAPLLDPKLEKKGIGIAITSQVYVTIDFCG